MKPATENLLILALGIVAVMIAAVVIGTFLGSLV
jgi:hypothetical protein